MRYTHRNGEKQPPTEGNAHYLVKEKDDRYIEAVRVTKEMRVWVIGSELDYAMSDFPDARWWGPIPEPDVYEGEWRGG